MDDDVAIRVGYRQITALNGDFVLVRTSPTEAEVRCMSRTMTTQFTGKVSGLSTFKVLLRRCTSSDGQRTAARVEM